MALVNFVTDDGFNIQVVACSFAFKRNTDNNGRPSSPPVGGTLNVTVLTTPDDTYFIDWLAKWNDKENATRKGSIEFRAFEGEDPYKTIEFDKGFIISFSENYDEFNDQNQVRKFEINAEMVKINDAKFTRKWPQFV